MFKVFGNRISDVMVRMLASSVGLNPGLERQVGLESG